MTSKCTRMSMSYISIWIRSNRHGGQINTNRTNFAVACFLVEAVHQAAVVEVLVLMDQLRISGVAFHSETLVIMVSFKVWCNNFLFTGWSIIDRERNTMQ